MRECNLDMQAKERTILLTTIFGFLDGDFGAFGAATRFFSEASREAVPLVPPLDELPFL